MSSDYRTRYRGKKRPTACDIYGCQNARQKAIDHVYCLVRQANPEWTKDRAMGRAIIEYEKGRK